MLTNKSDYDTLRADEISIGDIVAGWGKVVGIQSTWDDLVLIFHDGTERSFAFHYLLLVDRGW